MVDTSAPCPVPFLSCLAVLILLLLDGGPGVQAWLVVGVLLGSLGLGDKVRVSVPKAVIPRLTAGAVTFVVTDSPSVGVTMSPAEYTQGQMPETASKAIRVYPQQELSLEKDNAL